MGTFLGVSVMSGFARSSQLTFSWDAGVLRIPFPFLILEMGELSETLCAALHARFVTPATMVRPSVVAVCRKSSRQINSNAYW